jgi:hypothetical protein
MAYLLLERWTIVTVVSWRKAGEAADSDMKSLLWSHFLLNGLSALGPGMGVIQTDCLRWDEAGTSSDDSGVTLLNSSRFFMHGCPNRQQYRGSGERLGGVFSGAKSVVSPPS